MIDFNLVATVVTIVIIFGAIQGTCAYLIWVERKIAAYMQDRIGPNRVGPAGLLQPIADGLKFLFKEDIIPNHVDKLLFLAAPAIAVTTALFAFVLVPFGSTNTPPPPPQRPAVPTVSAGEQQLEQYHQDLEEYEQKAQV